MSEFWEDRYRQSGDYLFGKRPARVLTDNPGLFLAGQTSLCVADGEGRNSVHLARLGQKVTAFDPSATAVRRARDLATEAGVEAEHHCLGWSGWDWERTFDLTVAIYVQYAPPSEREVQFADLARATRPGGTVLLHGYTQAQLAYDTGGPRNPEQLYTRALLLGAFPGWEVLRLAEYEIDVADGRGHNGRQAVIDLFARRPA